MTFSVLTYNVLYNQAISRMEPILAKYQPDIICLQEVETEKKNLKYLEKYQYFLADYSNSFIKFGKVYGIATFYNKEKLNFVGSEIIFLPRSVYEVFLLIVRFLHGGNQPRTILRTTFVEKRRGKKMIVLNTHFSMVTSNGGRVKQIKEILSDLQSYDHIPLIVTGDFNYFPYGRRLLEKTIVHYGFKEATHSIPYTIRYSLNGKRERYNFIQKLSTKLYSRLFATNKLKVDYTLYKNLKLYGVKKNQFSLF